MNRKSLVLIVIIFFQILTLLTIATPNFVQSNSLPLVSQSVSTSFLPILQSTKVSASETTTPTPTPQETTTPTPAPSETPTPTPTSSPIKKEIKISKIIIKANKKFDSSLLRAVTKKSKWVLSDNKAKHPLFSQYIWKKDGMIQKTQVKSTVKITSKDIGSKWTVELSAKKQGYKTVTSKSAPFFVPVDNPKCSKENQKIICISKKDRKLRLIFHGKILLQLDARFGCIDTQTRVGSFKIIRKVKDEISEEYNDSPMPYAMYFAGGQAIHYSENFATVGYAKCSYGCVNIRDKKGIITLFNLAKVGTKVIIY